MITRRGLITGLGTLLCAPAIVRVSSLMPVSVWRELPPRTWFVASHTTSEGNGTFKSPLRTIAEAIERAHGNDTIVFVEGTLVSPLSPFRIVYTS